MTTITIERNKVERWLAALETAKRFVYQNNRPECEAAVEDLRAALAATATASDDIAEEMSVVADNFAHRLALELECILADYSGTHYETALGTLSGYREAMNRIHERESPTFMGEPVLPTGAAPATAPSWQDAPTEPGMWACLYMGELSTAIFNAYEIEHFDRDEMVGCRWRFIPEDRQ